MSVGMYISSYHKLKGTPKSKPQDLYSLNELKKLENYSKIISDLETNLDIDTEKINPNEKMFVFPNDLDEIFSVTREKDEGTINQYTEKPFIYYVDIYNWEEFYEPFSEFLQSLNAPFELWKIWEGKVEVSDLRTVELSDLNSYCLEKIYGLNEYLDPIVGIHE